MECITENFSKTLQEAFIIGIITLMVGSGILYLTEKKNKDQPQKWAHKNYLVFFIIGFILHFIIEIIGINK
jgi:hypothetical protein